MFPVAVASDSPQGTKVPLYPPEMRNRWVVAGSIALAGALLPGVPAEAGEAVTVTLTEQFTENGTFVVPDGVTSLAIEACGGAGGLAGSNGALVRSTLVVEPADELTLTIGKAGADGTAPDGSSPGGAGIYPGGDGGEKPFNSGFFPGAGGGGATGVTHGGTIIVVAGGGGGRGALGVGLVDGGDNVLGEGGEGGTGGAAGAPAGDGGDGTDGQSNDVTVGGGGFGGAGGLGAAAPSTSGTAGGDAVATNPSAPESGAGGGGGGGVIGGTGGDAGAQGEDVDQGTDGPSGGGGGGGAGSSAVTAPAVLVGAIGTGGCSPNDVDGAVNISYDRQVSISVEADGPDTVPTGESAALTVTVTNTGDVDLAGVSVSVPEAPDCDRADLGALAASGSTDYECTTPSIDDGDPASFSFAAQGTHAATSTVVSATSELVVSATEGTTASPKTPTTPKTPNLPTTPAARPTVVSPTYAG